MDRLVPMLKSLADLTRLRIVHLLAGREELCVCEIVDTLDIPQYSVSRHLGVLRAAGIVTDWRQGKWMHYALAPAMSEEERGIITSVCRRAALEPELRQDLRRLAKHMRPRENGEVVACT
jgi:ArsR family transcriptional regulator